MVKMEISSPSRNSSMTTSSPAEPNSLSTMTNFKASRASCLLLVKFSKAAVGMLCLAIKSLEAALEPSISAAFLEGPKTGIPTCLKASAIPSTNGCSGPGTTKLTPFSVANLTNWEKSEALYGTLTLVTLEY
ncbi:hypothetical protein WICPIJ_004950 [Wickerhamomyces pijperi]|uniref:Uncharacterized protein n=1 Tax=Wickerhamomyces pijperi TaxID=599730 RepID=A0A9P8Q6M1_WICPI|nr:hypothetical protein WICPIJ_004950 [Wickerhamomyces pijperi]